MSKDKQRVGDNPANINPTQERLQRIVKQIDKYFGIFGKVYYFLGIQKLSYPVFINSKYPESWWLYNLKRFEFVTASFLQFNWSKKIWVHSKTGFSIDDKYLHVYPKNEREEVRDYRSLYLYSPWIIDSNYTYSAPDRRIVVEVDGDEEIETHHFAGGVRRKKLLWWDSYRIQDSWSDDMTEFNRAVDGWIRNRGY